LSHPFCFHLLLAGVSRVGLLPTIEIFGNIAVVASFMLPTMGLFGIIFIPMPPAIDAVNCREVGSCFFWDFLPTHTANPLSIISVCDFSYRDLIVIALTKLVWKILQLVDAVGVVAPEA
jgi:hypothetical protein